MTDRDQEDGSEMAGAAYGESNPGLDAERARPGPADGREMAGAPCGNRTRVSAVKGPRPGPLDEGRTGTQRSTPRVLTSARRIEAFAAPGKPRPAGGPGQADGRQAPRHCERSEAISAATRVSRLLRC